MEWDLERLKNIAIDSYFYIHGDILLAVLISFVVKFLPYADKMYIKASLLSYDDKQNRASQKER